MKKCEICKKVFQDDMSYCPYCGTKYHDYKDDLRQALDDLFEENIVEKKDPLIKKLMNIDLLKKEKMNIYLNKSITVIFILTIAAMLLGIVIISEKFYPLQQGIIENTNPTIDQPAVNDEKPSVDQKDEIIKNDDLVKDIIDDKNQNVIDVSNLKDGDFIIKEIKVKKENDQVRIEIKCNALFNGKVYLKNRANLNIGPITIKEGNNQFYYLVNGKTDYQLYFESSNGRNYEYSITQNMIDRILNNY